MLTALEFALEKALGAATNASKTAARCNEQLRSLAREPLHSAESVTP